MTADRRGAKGQPFDVEKIKQQVADARACVEVLRKEASTLESLANDLDAEVTNATPDLGRINERAKALRDGMRSLVGKLGRIAPQVLGLSFLRPPRPN